jgi:tungstate transport system substrate-binding protein
MTIQRRRFLRAAGAGSVVGLAGCLDGVGSQAGGGNARLQSGVGDGELVLATTTSTYDTGLLDELNPVFEDAYGTTVKTISKGTGAAIRTARDGDADVILVHARGAEDGFLRDGFGVNRRDVMYNDFVVVGPTDDPAGIEGLEEATGALIAIADQEATFVSRGDDSGTHRKELLVWEASGVRPGGQWYQEVGKGMGDTLVQTSQIGGYTLADRGTYLSMKDEIDLAILVQGPLEGGPAILENPYGVIPVNPAKHESVNYQLAMAYVGFLTGPKGQGMIEEFTVGGSQLFFPNALAPEPNFGQYVPEGYTNEEAADLSAADQRYLHWVETQVPSGF